MTHTQAAHTQTPPRGPSSPYLPDLLVICPTDAHLRARIDAHFTAVYLSHLTDSAAWLRDNAATIRHVLTDGHLGVPPPVLDALPNLRAISCNGVGYDAIDVAAAIARGIDVSHTPGVLSEEVATTALMLYLGCWRNWEAELNNARSGAWAHTGALPLSHTAEARTVGIVGLGRIGKALARKLAPFGGRILYHGRTRQDVPYTYVSSLVDMARQCDALIVTVPGGSATHHLIDRAVIKAIGPGGYLVNVGRGSVVDQAALIAALGAGRLGGAGLDVFEAEPHIPDALRALPNVLLTPHIGSATVETRRRMGDLALDNLLAHRAGRGMLSPVPECRAANAGYAPG